MGHSWIFIARVIVCYLAMALNGIQPANAAAVTVDVSRHGNDVDINASAPLKADIATAWRVLTDYDRYVEFIPGLRSSHVVGRRGRTVSVEQSGDATWWLLRAPVAVTYEITEFPPIRLVSRTTAGCSCALESTYSLTLSGRKVLLGYTGRLQTRFEFFAPIERMAVQQTITRQFQALADEIDRSAATAAVTVQAMGVSK